MHLGRFVSCMKNNLLIMFRRIKSSNANDEREKAVHLGRSQRAAGTKHRSQVIVLPIQEVS